MEKVYISQNRKTLHNGTQIFNSWELRWKRADGQALGGDIISPVNALFWLYKEANGRQVPVGIIGPREATGQQLKTAEQLGKRFGELGIPLLTGGKNGVMELASKGCVESGGTVLGLMPDVDWVEANNYVTIPIATGIGKARNVLIAQSCLALVAIGGGYGTMSEIAFGLHFNKPVFAMEGAPQLDGVQNLTNVEDVITRLAVVILKISE